MKTAIIDYGAGNIHSLAKAAERAGLYPRVVGSPHELGRPDLIILPGQGQFGQVARAFRRSGFEAAVRDHVTRGGLFLGICVGLQLLLEGSEEAPGEPGLGLVPGYVRRFPAGSDPVPHMGWNRVSPFGRSPLLVGLDAGSYTYFAHSYYPALEAREGLDGGAVSSYAGMEFVSAFSHGNLHATQFHPEKSQAAGRLILSNLAYAAQRAAA